MEGIHDDIEKEKLTHEIVGNEKEVIEPILNTIRQFFLTILKQTIGPIN
jgi:hypothetical protein